LRVYGEAFMSDFDSRCYPTPAQAHALYRGLTAALIVPLCLLLLLFCLGCNASLATLASVSTPAPVPAPVSAPTPSPAPLTLAPASATIQAWQTIQLTLSGADNPAACTWTTSSSTILFPVGLPSAGDAEFEGQQVGSANVSVACGAQTAQAAIAVIPQAASGPIRITSGGTYSGIWNSDDPTTPAVTISTDQPVTLEDSQITGRGTLIHISGVTTGANVTIENVTGTALDPGVSGQQRGSFVSTGKINSLVVRNCTMTGVSFGIITDPSTVSTLKILNNLALNLEDRASDGQGGLLATRPYLGHFVILNGIAAPQGAEIGWNQIVQTMGQSSVEDVINIYGSQGAPGEPIRVHDNYIEGNSSPSAPANYTGTGIIADGSDKASVTAFASFEDNEIVHTAGSGVVIDNGHDVTATGNRIVSCGQDASGAWFAMSYVNATSTWDFYKTGPSLFYNNTITASAGGLVRPNAAGNPMNADFWGSSLSMTYPGNASSSNDFTNPCLVSGKLNLAAEDAERAYWAQKIAAGGELIGDQHE
jgi:hypothetical protein